MKRAEMVNPARARGRNGAEILIVNPKGRNMTRKKNSTAARGSTRAASPNRGRGRSKNQRSTSGRGASRPRRRNSEQCTALVPTNGQQLNPRRRGRRRNPKIAGIALGAIWGIGGATASRVISGFIPWRFDGLMGILAQFGVAYGVAWLAEKFTSPQNAQYAGIGAAGPPAAAAVDYLFGLTRTLGQSTGIFTGDAAAQAKDAAAALPPPPDTSKAQTVSGWDDGVMLHGVDDIAFYQDGYDYATMSDIAYYE